jgi:hypothetical protein
MGTTNQASYGEWVVVDTKPWSSRHESWEN